MRTLLALCRSDTPGYGPPISEIDENGKATKISSGNPSWLHQVPDFLQRLSSGGLIDGLISNRRLSEILAAPLPTSPDNLPDIDVRICCPVGGQRAELWTWLEKPAGETLRFPGKHVLFVRQKLAQQVARIFNPANVDTEGQLQASTRLDEIARGEEAVEVLIMPSWRAKEILPDAFPDRVPPFRRLDTDEERYDAWREKVDEDKKREQRRANADEYERQRAEGAVKVQAEVSRREKERTLRQEVERRVRREMGG